MTIPVPVTAKRYRKRPIVVEAMQWTGDNFAEIVEFIGDAFMGAERGEGFDRIYVGTLEGVMTANLGWWIIKGVHGEFYPCDPEVFAKSYDIVDDDDDDDDPLVSVGEGGEGGANG